jgi:ATP-binding cassette subfamily F protein 3
MEALSTKTLELSSGQAPSSPGLSGPPGPAHRLFYGDYAYYLDRSEREAAEGTAGIAGGGNSPLGKPARRRDDEPEVPAERREAEKRKQALIRRLTRQEAEILGELEALEAEKTKLEGELARPEVYSAGEKARAVQAGIRGLTARIDEKTREWEEKAKELERNRE